jgi:hypothetical protein
MKKESFEIIIAHYNEDLNWLKPYANNVIIYHKWNETWARFPVKKWVKLTNIWREWQTYLYHIIENYNNLAEINIFLQWNIDDHKGFIAYDSVEQYLKETKKLWFSSKNLQLMKRWKINFSKKFKEMIEKWTLTCDSWISLSDFYKEIFNREQALLEVTFPWWNFWVSKEKILQNDKTLYQKLLYYLSKSSNPIEWHYLERMWFRIFNKQRLKLVYIKKIIKSEIIIIIAKVSKFLWIYDFCRKIGVKYFG